MAGALPGEDGPLEFSGELADVTSEPGHWPRPLTLHVRGERGSQSLRLDALLDHRQETGEDRVDLVYRGYPLEGLMLGKEELAVAIKKAKADLTLKVVKKDERWDGALLLEARDAVLEPQTQMSGIVAQKLAEAVRGIRQFQVEVGFAGQENNLDFKLRSDIGTILAASLKAMFDQELAKQKKALEDKVNALYKEKADELEKSLADKKAVILGPLAKHEGALGGLLDRSVNQAKSSVAPSASQMPANVGDFKKLFKR